MSEKKISLAEIVYLLYFAVMFGAKAVGLYEGIFLYNVSILLGMVLFGIKVLLTEHTLLEYITMAILLCMCLVVYHNTGEKGLLFYMTLMLGMKGVSLVRLEKRATWILGICFTTLFILSMFGLTVERNHLSKNRFFFDGEVIRHSLGYPNPNVTHTTFVILMMLIVLVRGYRGRKDQFITCLFLYLANFYLYVFTMSNTGMIAATVFMIMMAWLYRKDSVSKLDGLLIGLLYPLCMFISIGLPMLIKGDLFWKLDGILHNRMNYPHYWMTHEPITPFGVRLGVAPDPDYYIDSSFLYSFLQLGVVPCVVLALLMLSMVFCLWKQNRKTELAIYVALCVLGLSDPFFYNLAYKNILFLFIGDMFFVWIGSIERRLPDIFGKKIRVVSCGAKEISYGDNSFFRIITVISDCLEELISMHGIRNLLLFVVGSIVISIIAYGVSAQSYVVGAIDTVDEWEYFRIVINIGVWCTAFMLFLLLWGERNRNN